MTNQLRYDFERVGVPRHNDAVIFVMFGSDYVDRWWWLVLAAACGCRLLPIFIQLALLLANQSREGHAEGFPGFGINRLHHGNFCARFLMDSVWRIQVLNKRRGLVLRTCDSITYIWLLTFNCKRFEVVCLIND